LSWLALDGLFAKETIEAIVVQGTAVLRLTQTLYDGSQRAVAHRVALCQGDRMRIQRIIQR
jgi:DNA-binding GntR family transcriptional regulator